MDYSSEKKPKWKSLSNVFRVFKRPSQLMKEMQDGDSPPQTLCRSLPNFDAYPQPCLKWRFSGLEPRPRPLTPASSPPLDEPKRLRRPSYLSQQQSHLFRLPAELRNEVYALVLSNHLVHMKSYHEVNLPYGGFVPVKLSPIYASVCEPYTSSSPFLRSLKDISNQDSPFDAIDDYYHVQGVNEHTARPYCFGPKSLATISPSSNRSPRQVLASRSHRGYIPHPPRPDPRLLSLPRTCRRLYAETIDLLYALNTFHLSHELATELSTRLMPYMLSQRLECITSLKIELHYAYIPVADLSRRLAAVYTNVFRSLQAMFPSLRRLRLCLTASGGVLVDSYNIGATGPPPDTDSDAWRKMVGWKLIEPLEPLCRQLEYLEIRTSFGSDWFHESNITELSVLKLFDMDGLPLFKRIRSEGESEQGEIFEDDGA